MKENELAKAIQKAPSLWQQQGGKFLAALIAVLVIIILIRYHQSSKRQEQAQSVDSLAQARNEIDSLQQSAVMGLLGPPQQMATQRRQYFNDANNAINTAMQLSDDHRLQAESLVTRGDLNWLAATLPELPGAATQPELRLKDPKDLLTTAAEAYQTILTSYANETYAVISARFGLAAIDENRGNYDAAKSQYEALAKSTKDFPGYQQIASQRLSRLATLRNPVIFGKPATLPAETATTHPATQPLPIGIIAPSALKPTTKPVTRP